MFDLRTEDFHKYLRRVYTRMAEEVHDEGSTVIEVGTRVWRGVITPNYIPHKAFMCVDRDPTRPGWNIDVLNQAISADVILSTCLLHHTPREHIRKLLGNLRAPLLMFSGPTADTHAPYGDHRWHLEEGALRQWFKELGYGMEWSRFGMSEPYCEAIVIARKT